MIRIKLFLHTPIAQIGITINIAKVDQIYFVFLQGWQCESGLCIRFNRKDRVDEGDYCPHNMHKS